LANVNIDQVLARIDARDYPKHVSQMVYEVSENDSKRIKAYELMRLALRWALLVDLHAETDNHIYFEEAKKQLAAIYQQLPTSHCKDLFSIESKARTYFVFEKELQARIKENERFTKKDIDRYLRGKSGDVSFYGRLLRTICPTWNLTRVLRIETMLGDISKDIKDYEDDVRHGLPNILHLMFSGNINKNKIPHDNVGALELANASGDANRVLKLATRLQEKAFASKYLHNSPTLEKLIVHHYSQIQQSFSV